MVEREIGEEESLAVENIGHVLYKYQHVNMDPARLVMLAIDLGTTTRSIGDAAYLAGVAAATNPAEAEVTA